MQAHTLEQQPTAHLRAVAAVASSRAGDGQLSGSTRLRLTTRGRLVIGALAILLVAGLFALTAFFVAPQAQATHETGHTEFTYVTMLPGDSLWTLAGRIAPSEDPRDVIDEIVRLNQLDSVEVLAGQELAIPAGYTYE